MEFTKTKSLISAMGIFAILGIASCSAHHATIIPAPPAPPAAIRIQPSQFRFGRVYSDRNGVQVKFFLLPPQAQQYAELYPQQVQHYPCQTGFFPALKKAPGTNPVLTCLAPIRGRTITRF